MILDKFPSPEEFYGTYWGKKPFIVRNHIRQSILEGLIDGDTLAGLALEDDIKSRIIINTPAGDGWTCEHGPFDEDRFDDIGDKNWSLLVQNVEQYHKDTAQLLTQFHFSPRWLLDDIMVSFSATGGSVGPHTDSYHTFLVQGVGKREWKISDRKIDDTRYAEGLDVKVLQNGFEGETFEVTAGDVIYMPPFFGHEGKTIEAAQTFSVGFLGPQISEILGEYALYLEENEALNTRYLGITLDPQSASFTMGQTTQDEIRNSALNAIKSDNFITWMTSYFSTTSHENLNDDETLLTSKELLNTLENGSTIVRPEHVKYVITEINDKGYNLAIYGEVIEVSKSLSVLIDKFNNAEEINFSDIQNNDEAIKIITALHSNHALVIND